MTSYILKLFYSTPKTQKLDRIGAPGERFEIFPPVCRKLSKKLKGDPLVKKIEKKTQFRKKLKGGPFGIFQHPFCRKTPEKMKVEPLRKTFFV